MKHRSSKGFFLYNSNKLENLFDKALDVLGSMSTDNPLQKTEIVVQSDGMGRWFSLKTASITGIYANTINLTVEKYLQKFAIEVLNINCSDVFESENLKWTIYNVLNDAPKSSYKDLNDYIAGDPLKRFLISGKCADLFDQYSVYRFDMINKWKNGQPVQKNDRDEKWQKDLFIEVVSKFSGHKDRVDLLHDFIKKCDNIADLPDPYRNGIVLFGISTMSEYHLLMFKALSKLIPVHLFFMNPCMYYWGDIVTTRKSEASKLSGGEDLYFRSDNRLLADLGISGKIFFNSLHEADAIDVDLFENEHGADSMLKKVQKEILNMNEDERFVLDGSIKINGCWGRTREMEVLKDELLQIFNKNPHIRPDDVVVITPDIEEYAPYIEAVFTERNGTPVIPFSIADRSARSDGKTIDAFLKMLKLFDSDFLKTDVLSIFEIEHVHKKFNITRNDLETVRTAVEESGIKWGIDKRFREMKGYPSFEQNTWKFGFDRMILGYSMPGRGLDTFGGVLPYDEIEGTSAKTVAKFITFCEILFKTANSFNMDRSLIDWAARLNNMVDEVFMDDAQTADEIRYLRKIFDKLNSSEKLSGIKCAVPLRVIVEVLEENIASGGFNKGFLNGNVTFCSIKPLRCIPFKVVCMAGMNDDMFPRDPQSTGFDLIMKYPSPKDRNPKNSDRYFFLESLLSAREYFIVSYSARNVRDSSFNICSSPVRLLSDYLAQKTKCDKDHSCFKETIHPLQPFSEKYFLKDSQLFTFSQRDHKAHQSFKGRIEVKSTELSQLPASINENLHNPDLNEFLSFFMNPPRYFLTKRLGITVPYMKKNDPDSEVFSIDNLQAYGYKNEYLDMYLKGLAVSDFKRKMKGTGRSPHGPAGQVLLNSAVKEMTGFLAKVENYRKGSVPEEFNFTKSVEVNGSRLEISGRLDSIYPGGQFFFKPAKAFNSKEKMKCWILHILMNALGMEKSTNLAAMESDIEIKPVKDPEGVLADLAGIYLAGLLRPLPVTPYIIENILIEMNKGENASDAFAKMLEKKAGLWGGSEDDFAFRTVADMTGFYSGSDEVVKFVTDIAQIAFGKFEQYKEESK